MHKVCSEYFCIEEREKGDAFNIPDIIFESESFSKALKLHSLAMETPNFTFQNGKYDSNGNLLVSIHFLNVASIHIH